MRYILAGDGQADLVKYSVLTRVRLSVGRDAEGRVNEGMWTFADEVRRGVHHIGDAVAVAASRAATGMQDGEVSGGGPGSD